MSRDVREMGAWNPGDVYTVRRTPYNPGGANRPKRRVIHLKAGRRTLPKNDLLPYLPSLPPGKAICSEEGFPTI